MTTEPVRTETGFLTHLHNATTGATISSGDGYEQDPTRRIEVPNETVPPRSGYTGEPLEGEADFVRNPSSDEEARDLGLEEEHEPRRGRDIGLAVAGALLGVLFTFVFIALTTGGGTAEVGDDPAAAEREAELEAELTGREQQVEELDARIADLESQLAAAGDDGADRDAELAEQRDALEERLAAIEAREEELDNLQASLDERADALDQRERTISEAETNGDPPADSSPGEDTGEDSGDGIDLDDLGDTAEGVIERVLDEIRNLFGQD